MKKIAIFASGTGSNAKKIIEYFNNHDSISVDLVLANKPDAGVLTMAQGYGINTRVFDRNEFYETDNIVKLLKSEGIDFIALAGFLWLIPTNLIESYENMMVNIHPALLPKFGGKGMYGQHVHQAVVAAGEKESGMTIHLVNQNFDEGRILFQGKCEVRAEDSPTTVAANVLKLEHQHFAPVIEEYLSS